MLAITFALIVSAHSLHSTYAAATKQASIDSPIQYPESVEVDDDIPDACKDLTYCTVKPKNYPEEKFNKMFKGYKAVPQPSMLIDIENRQGNPVEEDNCESIVTFEPLYKVKDNDLEGVWRTVVQAPESDFVQRVRLERCKDQGKKCFTNFSSKEEFVTFCKQKLNKWQVLVAKGENETEMIKTELPVCCSCHYKPLDFVTRFGKH